MPLDQNTRVMCVPHYIVYAPVKLFRVMDEKKVGLHNAKNVINIFLGFI